MKIRTSIKILIVNAFVFWAEASYSWSVPDTVVELPESSRLRSSVVAPKAPLPDTPLKPLATELPAKKVEGGVFEKRKALLDPEEQAQVDYRRALEHLDNGQIPPAKVLLMNALSEWPRFHAARVELSTLYIKENAFETAENLLSEGLNLDENNTDFLRLMSVICDKRHEPEKALALLLKVKDSGKEDKSYMAFLGHIYQQTGRYALARQQYFHLLQLEPQNALWLLGVSVALEAEGQKGAALEGYRRLASEGNLEAPILKYVQDRIQILRG